GRMERPRMSLIVGDRDARLFLNDRDLCRRRPRFAGELLDARAVVGALGRDRYTAAAVARPEAAAAAPSATATRSPTAAAAAGGSAARPVRREPDLVGLLRQCRVQYPDAGDRRRRGLAVGRRLRGAGAGKRDEDENEASDA